MPDNKIPIRIYYIWSIALSVIGIAVSIYLIPRPETIAFIEAKAQRFEEAEKFYSEKYHENPHRTPDLLFELSNLELEKGNIKEATRYMDELVKQYPHNRDVLNAAKNLYLSTTQYEKYNSVQLELYKQLGNEKDYENLLALRQTYKEKGQGELQEKILEEIIHSEKGTSQTYLELAHLYAQQHKFEEALKMTETRRKLFPEEVATSDIFFEISVISHTKKSSKEAEKESLELLTQYLYKKDNLSDTEAAVDFIDSDHPEWLLDFVKKIKPLIEKHPAAQLTVIESLWYTAAPKSSERKDAESMLETLRQKQPKNSDVDRFYFKILQEKNDPAKLKLLIQRIDPATVLTEDDLFEFAEWASSSKYSYLSEEMLAKLPHLYLENHPVVALSLEVVAHPEKDYEQQLHLVLNKKIPTRKLIPLFQLLVTSEKNKEAFEVAAQLYPYSNLKEKDLSSVAFLYIQNKRAEEFEKLLQKALPKIRKRAGAALALLDAYHGRTKRTAEWLAERKQVDESILSELSTIAEEKQEYPLALYVAKIMVEKYPSLDSQTNYANALINNGQLEEGFAKLEALYSAHSDEPDVVNAYFDGLLAASKKNPTKYEPVLRSFLSKKKLDSSISPDQLRDYADAHVMLHDFHKAKEVLEQLVSENKASQDDIETLIQLWGPCVTEKQAAFIIQQAWSASAKDLGNWLSHLNYISRFCETVRLFQTFLSKKGAGELSKDAYFSYLDALDELKMYNEIRCLIKNLLCTEMERDALERLAGYAENSYYYEGLRYIRNLIVMKAPKDPVAWQKLADVAYLQNDDCAAIYALRTFFILQQQEKKENSTLFVSLYEYGEILERHLCFRKARKSYLCALAQIYQSCQRTFEMMEYEALILQRLFPCDPGLAIAKMRNFYQWSAYDLNVASDLLILLLDVGSFRAAQQLMNEVICQ